MRRAKPDEILPRACYRDPRSHVLIPGCYSVINGHPCTCRRINGERKQALEEVLQILRAEGLPFDGGTGTVPQHAVARAVRRIMDLAAAPLRTKPAKDPTP